MKAQTYYNTPLEKLANVCDMSKPLVVNCVGAVDDSRSFINKNVRNDYYLMYFLQGCMDIEINGEKHIIKSGEVLVMEPGTIYAYSCSKGNGNCYIWIHFTGHEAKELLNKYSIPANTILSCGQIASMIEKWKRMFREFVLNDKYFEDSSSSLLKDILISFSRHINEDKKGKRILKSVLYIHENYHKKISISYLASMENISESHYRALFLKMFGESPTDYITSRRIEAAMELLTSTDKKLDEISSLAGYNDSFYFGRQFKNKVGISPGRYRKQKM